MLEYLDYIDKKLLLFINSHHSLLWDQIMIKATDRFFWIPFYALIVGFIIWKFKKQSWILFLIIPILIITIDQFSSALLKPLFERLRPCHDNSINYLLHLANGCGGRYGFVSSHAGNTFGLATFLILLLRKQYNFIYILFLWAFFVSYSRIYLGAHYPGDIIFGALIGGTFAIIAYKTYLKISSNNNNRLNKDNTLKHI